MIAGGDHRRVIELLADLTMEGIFEAREVFERRIEPVGRVRHIVGSVHGEEKVLQGEGVLKFQALVVDAMSDAPARDEAEL